MGNPTVPISGDDKAPDVERGPQPSSTTLIPVLQEADSKAPSVATQGAQSPAAVQPMSIIEPPPKPVEKFVSVKGAVADLVNTVIGAGFITLPYVLKLCGLTGLVLIIAVGILTYITIQFLVEAREFVNQKTSFRSLAVLVLRKGWVGSISEAAVIIQSVGVCAAYLMIVGGLMPQIMEFMVIGIDGIWVSRWFWITVFYWLIAFPLSTLKSLSSLAFVSGLAVVAVGLTFTLVLFKSLTSPMADIYWWPDSIASVFKAVPMIGLSYACQMNTFPIYEEIKDKTKMPTVVGSTVTICTSLYAAMALCGFLSFGEEVETNVLMNYEGSIEATIGRLAMVFLVTFSFPLITFPARVSLDSIVKGSVPLSDKTRYWVETICVSCIPYALAMAVTDLGTVFSLVGAVSSTIIAYIMPALVYIVILKQHTGTKRSSYILPILCLFVGGIVFVVSPLSTLGVL